MAIIKNNLKLKLNTQLSRVCNGSTSPLPVQRLLFFKSTRNKLIIFLGKTAFHVASQCGQVDVLRRLLEVLENSESVHDLVDKNGLTPLHWAAFEGHESCVDLLISMITCYTAVKGTEFSPIHCAV